MLCCLINTVVANTLDEAVNAAAERSAQWAVIPLGTPMSRGNTAICTLGDSAYVFGGLTLPDEVVVGDLWRLDFDTLELTELHPGGATPQAREKHQITCDAARGAVYLIGGKRADDVGLEDLWVYYPANNTWQETPSDPTNGFTFSIFDTDFVCMGTTDHIVLAGNDGGEHSMFVVYDKRDEVWKPRGYDSRLRLEDPGGVGVGDRAILSGGVYISSALPNKTYSFDMSSPDPTWEDLVTDGMAGEEFKMNDLGGGVLSLIGDPGGKGPLAQGNRVALLNLSTEPLHWETVSVMSDADWVPHISEFTATTYKGLLIVLGGAVRTGDAVVGNTEVYIFNPQVCPQSCNGRGECVLGNCVRCRGHSGVACEVENPTVTDLTHIVVGVGCGGAVAFAIILAVSWRATAKSRAFRRLYNTNRVAEDMAEQIAAMELDSLDYLLKLANPTRVQSSFISIISTLKLYKMYLPDSVLQSVAKTVDDQNSEGAGAGIEVKRGGSGGASSSSCKVTTVQPKATSATVHTELTTKLTKKNLSATRFLLEGFTQHALQHGVEWSDEVHAVAGSFAGLVHSVVSATKGTIIAANLAAGAITAAWNFITPRGTPSVAACGAAYEAHVQALGVNTPLLLRAAMTTRQGLAGNLGSEHLRVPALVGPHSQILDLLMGLAVARQLSVVSTEVELQYYFKMAPVDVVSGLELVTRSGVRLLQKQVEKNPIRVLKIWGRVAAANEEWMYAMERATTSSEYVRKLLETYESEGTEAAFSLYITMKAKLPKDVVEALADFVDTVGSEFSSV